MIIRKAVIGVNREICNLVAATYDKGAHFVLGTLEDIGVSDAENFLEGFLVNCSSKNIFDSVALALGDDPLFDLYYMGDTKQFLGAT